MAEWCTTFYEQHREFLVGLGIGLTIFSIVAFIVGIVITPWLILKMPADYFVKRAAHIRKKLTMSMLVPRIVRNCLGVVFLLVGIALLVLPGPGWLTILLGVTLLDFPGKYRLEIWIIKLPFIKAPVDLLRQKHNREPIQFP
ncbi:MAG: hypothetical protein EHM28_11445 [Spirochaetaceae bacterium]|nr:MAG: hypothetical protein EHM28_11445 [Spirochaetaceae bacterium]